MPAQSIKHNLPTMLYHLPSSPEIRVLDRFSIIDDPSELEDSNGDIPFWPIIQNLLATPIGNLAQLADLLGTIAVTVRGTSHPAGDYGLLKEVLDEPEHNAFFSETWPCLVSLALELPTLFPNHTIPVLGTTEDNRCISLSRRQTACLVVHQFLTTLRPPEGRPDFIDFSIWYDSQLWHPEACEIYLTALLRYFHKVTSSSSSSSSNSFNDADNHKITFTLRTAGPEESPNLDCPMREISVVVKKEYATSPEDLGLPHGAAVISANKVIGFGQSATQEEIHVGSSPEAAPAVLFTPTLGDAQVLVVKGAEAVVHIVGQRRGVRLGEMVMMPREIGWEEREMLFMDALEIDMMPVSDDEGAELPDLLPQHVDREILKAWIAFSSGQYEVVKCPLWGCGAFGGDPGVKVLLLWCAASCAGSGVKKLEIVCDEDLRGVAEELREVIEVLKGSCKSARELKEYVLGMPKGLKRLETLKWVLARERSA